MAYLWQDYTNDKFFYVAEKLSPYEEISNINSFGKRKAVNPLIRFDEIFEPLFEYITKQKAKSNDEDLSKDERQELENIILHFLAILDFRRGISKSSVIEKLIERDILSGFYGETIKHRYRLLTRDKQIIICNLLRKKAADSNKKSYFYQSVQQFFSGARMYYYVSQKKFLLYLPYAKTATNERKINLLLDLFFDITSDIEIFWNKHFGILGRTETMCMDKMIIY